MNIPTTVFKIGHSIAVRIPSEVVKELKLVPGMNASIIDKENKIIEIQFK